MNLLKILKKEKCGEGHSCSYIRVNDKIGLKVVEEVGYDYSGDGFDDDEVSEGQIVFDLHKLAYDIGVGPKVWNYQVVNGTPCFFIENCFVYTDNPIDFNDLTKLVYELMEICADSGYTVEDLHEANLGWLNGKLVIIDGGCLGGDGPCIDEITMPKPGNVDIDSQYADWLSNCRYCGWCFASESDFDGSEDEYEDDDEYDSEEDL